jgi:hypothetical protein
MYGETINNITGYPSRPLIIILAAPIIPTVTNSPAEAPQAEKAL